MLDLCVEHRQPALLTLVLRRGLASSRDSLEKFLVKTEFCHAASILPELVRLDTKSSLLLLNHWVTATAGHATTAATAADDGVGRAWAHGEGAGCVASPATGSASASSPSSWALLPTPSEPLQLALFGE